MRLNDLLFFTNASHKGRFALSSRAAESRTRPTSSQRMRTTAIRRPAFGTPERTYGVAKPAEVRTGDFSTLHYLRQIRDPRHAVAAAEPHEGAVDLPLPFPVLLKDIPLSCPCDFPYLRLVEVQRRVVICARVIGRAPRSFSGVGTRDFKRRNKAETKRHFQTADRSRRRAR